MLYVTLHGAPATVELMLGLGLVAGAIFLPARFAASSVPQRLTAAAAGALAAIGAVQAIEAMIVLVVGRPTGAVTVLDSGEFYTGMIRILFGGLVPAVVAAGIAVATALRQDEGAQIGGPLAEEPVVDVPPQQVDAAAMSEPVVDEISNER